VSPFSSNVSRRTPLFSVNVSRKSAMFSSRADYVLKPLHLAFVFSSILPHWLNEKMPSVVANILPSRHTSYLRLVCGSEKSANHRWMKPGPRRLPSFCRWRPFERFPPCCSGLDFGWRSPVRPCLRALSRSALVRKSRRPDEKKSCSKIRGGSGIEEAYPIAKE